MLFFRRKQKEENITAKTYIYVLLSCWPYFYLFSIPVQLDHADSNLFGVFIYKVFTLIIFQSFTYNNVCI